MTTKQYLRFEPSSVFGVIASSIRETARILHLDRNKKCNFVAVPACEDVIVWNLHSKEKSLILRGELSYVTCLIYDSSCNNIAVGYHDGFIRIFDVKSGNCVVSFCGHKADVTCLAYDNGALNLASGGEDSEIVVWNITDQAGLFRLKGHKGGVTRCLFLKGRNIVISSAKDSYIKLWDLETQHCFQTIPTRDQVLDFITINDTRLIIGRNMNNLEVFDLYVNEDVLEQSMKRVKLDTTNNEGEQNVVEDMDDPDEKFKYDKVGEIITAARTSDLIVDKTERIFGYHSSGKELQLFKVLTQKSGKRKVYEERSEYDKEASVIPEDKLDVSDQFQPLKPIKTDGKIVSFSISVIGERIVKVSVLLKNNRINQYELKLYDLKQPAVLCHSIILPGHRTVVQSLNYSPDNLSILSLSKDSVKIWRRFREEQVCTHTIECNGGLCSLLVSGNTYCVIGTKKGNLEIFDINSQQLLETISAHEGPITCLCESPNQCGIASGSRDKKVKFWDFELLLDENFSKSKKRMSLSLKKTLEMPDEVTCLRYSPDNKKIAIALLDFKVEVFFTDSLKHLFTLVAHTNYVSCMDISYDSTLIVTGSQDKNIRIWSMEFGCCNKFIKLAHDDEINCLFFLPKTHMFFSGGNDRVIKQWDADNFKKIITLKGHQGSINAMAVSPDGVTVVTASSDRTIRIWEKTQEPLVLEDERDKELEEEKEVNDLPNVPGEVNKETALPGLKTIETVKSVEQLIEAIDVYKQEVIKLKKHELECKKLGKEIPPPTPHPLLIAYSASSPIRYMLKVIKKIKSSELEGTLLYLPFNYVLDFFKILCEFVDRGWETELCERCSSFLVRIHMGQLLLAENIQPVIEKLTEKLFSRVYDATNKIGVVKTACQLHQRAIDEIEDVPMFTSVLDGLQKKKRKSKNKSHPIVTFS